MDLYNFTFPLPDKFDSLKPPIQTSQIVALVCYGLVVFLGVPGNALVVWITGFCMQRSVTSIWFLNLAVADLLCCLSLPLLMVPLVHDDHWHFGRLACPLVKGTFYLVMYCSVLQLVLISLDRYLLVTRPVWCQNKRRLKQASFACVAVWCLALLSSIPHFVYTKEITAGELKRVCVTVNTPLSAWFVTSFRSLLGFFVPFLVIVVCHVVVYRRAASGLAHRNNRSQRTVRVIVAVVLSFFLCWLPLNIVSFVLLVTPKTSNNRPSVNLAHAMSLCLAYFNSCLNPLLYVCLGRGFKDNMNRSVRNILLFFTEDPVPRTSIVNVETKSTSYGKEMTKV